MYKVLIVDDEALVISSLKKRISWEKHGFKIAGEARNGIAAYEKILYLKPEVVFTDIRMAGMDGLELIQKVSMELIKLKFVVISGYAEFEYAQKALNYGALGFCLKPFDENEIIGILNKARDILDSENDIYVSSIDNQTSMPMDTRNETFLSILNYVNVNFCREELSIQNIANEFLLNPNYISQLFKKEKGENFTEYLTNLRISHACSLLKNSNLPVYEIAERSGYSNYFHFAKVFKKVTNVTPTEYRAV